MHWTRNSSHLSREACAGLAPAVVPPRGRLPLLPDTSGSLPPSNAHFCTLSLKRSSEDQETHPTREEIKMRAVTTSVMLSLGLALMTSPASASHSSHEDNKLNYKDCEGRNVTARWDSANLPTQQLSRNRGRPRRHDFQVSRLGRLMQDPDLGCRCAPVRPHFGRKIAEQPHPQLRDLG